MITRFRLEHTECIKDRISPIPDFSSSAYNFTFVLKNMNYSNFSDGRENTPTVTPTVTPTAKISKEQRIETILEFCKTPKSRQEIMNEVGLKDKMSFLTGYLNPLLREGKLSYKEPDKPNSATQKYITVIQGE